MLQSVIGPRGATVGMQGARGKANAYPAGSPTPGPARRPGPGVEESTPMRALPSPSRSRWPVALALGLLSFPALAVNWVPVGQSGDAGDQVVASADLDSVRLREGLRQAWVRYDFDQPNEIDGLPHRSAQLLMHYDCERQVSTFSQLQAFEKPKGEGRIVLERSWPRKFDASELKPDRAGSLAHQVLQAVCAATPRRR